MPNRISGSNRIPGTKSILLLTLAGLISGFLSVAAGNMHSFASGNDAIALVYKGLLFGFCVSACFVLFERVRAIWRIAGFIVACVAADMASFYVAQWVNSINVSSPSDPMGLEMPVSMFLAAGFAGAFIILGAGLLLFGPAGMNWKAFASVFLGGVAGALLGILGWRMDDTSVLFVAWQAGIALLLGLILAHERSRTAAEVRAL